MIVVAAESQKFINFDSFEFYALLLPVSLVLALVCRVFAGRSVASTVWFPYVSAFVFTGLVFLEGGFFAILLTTIALVMVYATRDLRYGIGVVFSILIGLNLAEQIAPVVWGYQLAAPLGFSYLILRWYDALKVGGASDWRKNLQQSMLLPALPAGPVLLSGQWRVRRVAIHFDHPAYRHGLFLCLLGVAKLLFLAPAFRFYFSAGLVVTPGFDYNFLSNLLATGFYDYVRLFLDFSGYTDLAVGTSALLGLRIRHNFNRPYFALSLRDFWRRWHIPLGMFLRRHVYFPMGGSRHRHSRNILIVFLLLGIWHGFTAGFIVWGLLHGLYLVFEIRLLTPVCEKLSKHRIGSYIARTGQYISTHLFLTLTWPVFFYGGRQLVQ